MTDQLTFSPATGKGHPETSRKAEKRIVVTVINIIIFVAMLFMSCLICSLKRLLP